ncbi:hypothetical protein ROJ8625_02620 [Roseivivax jejudonensis]|uniref:Uncharacterized protein n=1 Tax=Roseivivax jejudonensis TaxID=1529041 RepID=A0A1X6ZIS1_9RHOB|nr:hypothetical protein [Roseivivax jejudonensis]SLN52140.1 hypothetical protein ROJ8625_02620 [Roseivivax jejudonensis]
MFVLTRETVLNPAALDTRSLPKKVFGRIMPWPRRGICGRDLARLIFEVQILRYVSALIPFLLAMAIWPHLALPIAQAPLPMVIVLSLVEMRVLRLAPEARKRRVDADEAGRRLDRLAFRARGCLRRIAAAHDLREGDLRLVVEQSELARVPPLTLVSVQSAHPAPHLLDLQADDRAILHAGLFDAELTEAHLLAANQREDTYVREVEIDARSVSGHARMAAWIARTGEPVEAGA